MQALFNALRPKNLSLVRSLVKLDKINIDYKYPKIDGRRTLHKIVHDNKDVTKEDLFDAIRQKNPLRVREIIKLNRICLDLPSSKEDRTALHLAASLGSLEIVKILVEEGRAKIGCMDKFGESPQCVAFRNRHYNIVNYFTKLRRNRRLFIDAVQQKNSSMVQRLIRSDKSLVRFRYPDYELSGTILHVAAGAGSLEIVKILVEEGHADFRQRDDNGEFPKELAALYGHVDVVHYLTQAGCKCNVDFYMDRIKAKQAKQLEQAKETKQVKHSKQTKLANDEQE